MENLEFNLRELQQVQAIASEGSFVRAARMLHISQPALSRSIQEMEEKAGFRLFDRGRDGAVPTDTGRMVIRHAQTVTEAALAMQRELALIRGLGRGELRVGSGVFPTELFLGRTLSQLAIPGTRSRLRIVAGAAAELLKLLRRRELDMVVADPVWLENTADVTAVVLSSHRGFLVVRAGHPLLDLPKLKLESVTGYPLVTSSAVTQQLSELVLKKKAKLPADRAVFKHWNPAIYTDSVSMMKETVMASDAITILPLYTVRHELEAKCVKVLPLELSWIQAQFAVMFLRHRTLSPLAEALVGAARKAAMAVEAAERKLEKRYL